MFSNSSGGFVADVIVVKRQGWSSCFEKEVPLNVKIVKRKHGVN